MNSVAYSRRSRAIRSLANSLSLILLLAAFFIPTVLFANSEYYRHTFFDNSRTSDTYFYSSTAAFAPSQLEQKNSKLPVETTTFLTPPNALRLEWQSLEGGNWQAAVHLVSFRNRFPDRSEEHTSELQ